MMAAVALTGWAVAAFVAALAILGNRETDRLLGKMRDCVTTLYAENCTLQDKIADKDAVILRQQTVIEAKNAELDRIGVRRNAKGQLESIR